MSKDHPTGTCPEAGVSPEASGPGFDDWFLTLQTEVLQTAGLHFRDQQVARDEFQRGRTPHEVAREVCAEYGA